MKQSKCAIQEDAQTSHIAQVQCYNRCVPNNLTEISITEKEKKQIYNTYITTLTLSFLASQNELVTLGIIQCYKFIKCTLKYIK